MSLLPAGYSLRAFLPDLDDLRESPADYLGIGPVVIGPRRMYGLAFLFAVPGVALLLAYFYGKPDPERIALGVGLLLGSMVWFGWSLWARGHALVLQRDGVEVKHHGLSVWCPWAVFNAAGEPHVPEVDSPFSGLILPVAADALPFIELRKDESVIAHGLQVRGPQFLIVAADEVILPGRYEVASRDLGDLLLRLGQTLGNRLPRRAPPSEAYQGEPEPVPDIDPAGWITARATRLRFPPSCCVCREPTRETMQFEAWSRGGWAIRIFLPRVRHEVAIAVSVCPECQAETRARLARGGARGLAAGVLAGPAALMLCHLAGWAGDVRSIALLGCAAAGGLLGFAVGHALSSRPPVQVRGYVPTRGTVRLRFRNPEYAALVVDLMRQRRPPS